MAETRRRGSALKDKKNLGMVSQVWGWEEKEWRKEEGRWDREVGEALDKVPQTREGNIETAAAVKTAGGFKEKSQEQDPRKGLSSWWDDWNQLLQRSCGDESEIMTDKREGRVKLRKTRRKKA